jgi:hypothetical protein
MKTILSLTLLALVACLIAPIHSAANTNEDLEDAKLLVVKSILNNYIVEGLDLSIKYTIYNIGNRFAAAGLPLTTYRLGLTFKFPLK